MNETRLNLCLSRCVPGIAAAVLLVAQGCGGSDAAAPTAKAGETALPEALQHEDCPESGNRVVLLDTNGDGKPDIRRVLDSSGHELCRAGDLNHDGKAELYEYFDANGTIRRREYCYDDTGVVNAIEHYEGGKLVRREYDAQGQHHIDTWDWFDPNAAPDPKTGRPAHPLRRERDTTGDGRVDQWWTWNGDKITIAVDSTGDGKPDPASTLTLGGSGGDNTSAPPPAPDSAAEAPAAADAGAGVATSMDGGKP